MFNVIVGSTNPVKIDAVRTGFEQMFPGQHFRVEGIHVASGVSAQPVSDAETRQGAHNRAHAAATAQPDADYWVGIEGGLEEQNGVMHVFAWIIVLTKDRTGHSRTATFILPDEVAALIRQGKELGEADDLVFGRRNSKQQNGSVGLLTADIIEREGYYRHAVVLALIPFKNPALRFGPG